MGIEPPFGDIWDGLRTGQVIPFLGAGASMVHRLPDASWTPAHPTFLPSGVELARYLAERSNFPSKDSRDLDDLAKVSSYSADVSGRALLKQRLRQALNGKYEYGALHRLLAEVPAHLLIVVTNYDTLLEDAFRDAGKPYDLVVYAADRPSVANALLWWPHGSDTPTLVEANDLDLNLSNTSVIYKMHGSVWPPAEEWDNFVITEEDYIEFLSRMTTNASSAVPAQFYHYSRNKSFLFLGYSLRDWNLRVVLRNLRRSAIAAVSGDPWSDGTTPSWAIQRNPSPLEQRLWGRRLVDIFDMDLDTFVARLRDGSAVV
jgi:SIR2-like protein